MDFRHCFAISTGYNLIFFSKQIVETHHVMLPQRIEKIKSKAVANLQQAGIVFYFLLLFIIKFRYNAHSDWLKVKSLLHKSMEHLATAFTPSPNSSF